jgi:hypothetical protein
MRINSAPVACGQSQLSKSERGLSSEYDTILVENRYGMVTIARGEMCDSFLYWLARQR